MKAQVHVGGNTLTVAGLWTGISAGPFSWFLNEIVRRLAVAQDCSTGELLPLQMLTLGALILCALGFLCSWKSSSVFGETSSQGSGEDSRRAMATAGMILTVGFALVILATAVRTLGTCN